MTSKRTLGHFTVHKIAPAFVLWKNPGQHIFFRDFLTFIWCEVDKKRPKNTWCHIWISPFITWFFLYANWCKSVLISSTINFYGRTFLVVQNPLLNQVGRIFPLVNMWSHCLTLITLAVLKSCLGKYGIHSTDSTILKK